MKEPNLSFACFAAAMALSLLGAYSAAYYLRGEYVPDCMHPEIGTRLYPSEWEARVFEPATKVESAVTGKHISPLTSAPIE